MSKRFEQTTTSELLQIADQICQREFVAVVNASGTHIMWEDTTSYEPGLGVEAEVNYLQRLGGLAVVTARMALIDGVNRYSVRVSRNWRKDWLDDDFSGDILDAFRQYEVSDLLL